MKEMRLRNISSMEAENGFYASFIAFWNERFAVPPRDDTPAPRPWTGTVEALDDVPARCEEQTLTKALTVSAAGTKYRVGTNEPGSTPRGRWAMSGRR